MPDIMLKHVARNTLFIHGLSIAVNQRHVVASGSKCLQQKHPEMRHEITRDADATSPTRSRVEVSVRYRTVNA